MSQPARFVQIVTHNMVPCPFCGGTPSPSHNTSTDPMSFPGGTPVTGPQSQAEGVPQSWLGVSHDGYPPWSGQGGVPPRSGWCTPLPGVGYPLASSGWGTPLGQDLGTPQSGQDGVLTPPRTGYARAGYAAGGTPLSVSRRRTVLLLMR